MPQWPSCGWSSAVESITPHGTNTLPGIILWCWGTGELSGYILQHHIPPVQGESLWVGSGLQHKLCSRRCVRVPILRLFLISVQHLWPPRTSAKKKSSCFMPLWLYAVNSSCSQLCALYYITTRWNNTRLGLSSYVVKTFGTVMFSKPPPLTFRNCKCWKNYMLKHIVQTQGWWSE